MNNIILWVGDQAVLATVGTAFLMLACLIGAMLLLLVGVTLAWFLYLRSIKRLWSIRDLQLGIRAVKQVRMDDRSFADKVIDAARRINTSGQKTTAD